MYAGGKNAEITLLYEILHLLTDNQKLLKNVHLSDSIQLVSFLVNF